MNKQQTKQIDGQVVLDNESGNRFYHRALARKARLKKKTKRRQCQRSQRGNRRKS